jgi:nucleoredoxin
MAAASSAISSLSPLVAEDGSSIVSSEEDLQERFAGKRVALYFSAGWCPMCTSFEPALEQFRKAAEDSGKPVEIVYVPSDRSESDASARARAMGMTTVPFDKAGDYKKSFGVWAGSEALKFGFGGRRSGVPAIVVLDPSDGTELAFVAAESQGARALGNWPLEEGVW